MALVSTSGGMWLPAYDFWNGGAGPAAAATLLDATADRWAVVFTAPKTGTLDKVRIRLGTVSIAGSSTVLVSFQDVDATTGNPDGTEDQFRQIPNGSLTSNTSVLTGKITSDGTDSGSSRSVTRGDLLAVVARIDTFTAADQVNINNISATTRCGGFVWHYVTENLSGAYAKSSTKTPQVSIQYSDGSYAEVVSCYPVITVGTQTYNNTSSPDEYGLRFQVPFPCKIGGCWLGIDADGDFDIVLYDSGGATTLKSVDKDNRSTTVAQVGHVLFTTEATLAADTTYVLSIKPTSATNLILSYVDVADVKEWDQYGGGQQWYWAEDKDPATTADFATTTTRRPMIGLMVTAVDNGATGTTLIMVSE